MWSYRTKTLQSESFSALASVVFGARFWVAALRKREGNPFPDRISVGRASNCDVVLRLPFISKLHAHIVLSGDDAPKIVDQGSSNGVKVNGVALPSKGSHPINVGDKVSFGDLELQVIDAGGLYDLVESGGVEAS